MIGKNVQLHVILSSQGSSKKRRLLNAAEGLKKGDIFAPDNPLLDQIIGQLLSHHHHMEFNPHIKQRLLTLFKALVFVKKAAGPKEKTVALGESKMPAGQILESKEATIFL